MIKLNKEEFIYNFGYGKFLNHYNYETGNGAILYPYPNGLICAISFIPITGTLSFGNVIYCLSVFENL